MANDPETTAFNAWVDRDSEERGERAAFAAGWEAAERFARFVNGTQERLDAQP